MMDGLIAHFFSSPIAKTMGEGGDERSLRSAAAWKRQGFGVSREERPRTTRAGPGNTGWWRGRAESSVDGARPLHHSLCGERSPSSMLFGMGEERACK